MRVVFWGTYDIGKPRVRILRQGLRLNDIEVLECHADLWVGIEDKSQVKGMAQWMLLFARALTVYPKLVWRYLRMPEHDVVMVLYPGLVDLFILRIFAWLKGKPIAWDWFLSAYDTIALDRRLLSPGNPFARLVYGVEWFAARLADIVFMDTATHAKRMEVLYRLKAGTIKNVWVGVEREHFRPDGRHDRQRAEIDTSLHILFYGQFIPLHGIPCIVAAADLLRDAPIQWLLVGHGQETPRIEALLRRSPLPKLQCIKWLPYEQLREALLKADIALGIFGSSEKAASVIPNKVFQILAAQRPLITRDSPAIRELVTHSPPKVQLIPADDASALAEAVLAFAAKKQNPAHDAIPDLTGRFDEKAIGKQLADILQSQ